MDKIMEIKALILMKKQSYDKIAKEKKAIEFFCFKSISLEKDYLKKANELNKKYNFETKSNQNDIAENLEKDADYKYANNKYAEYKTLAKIEHLKQNVYTRQIKNLEYKINSLKDEIIELQAEKSVDKNQAQVEIIK